MSRFELKESLTMRTAASLYDCSECPEKWWCKDSDEPIFV